ncbi:unnamed protein product [Calypogeia fissa]
MKVMEIIDDEDGREMQKSSLKRTNNESIEWFLLFESFPHYSDLFTNIIASEITLFFSDVLEQHEKGSSTGLRLVGILKA